MDLDAYRTAVNTQCGISLSSAAVDLVINQALRQVAAERDWPWLDLEETGTWPAAETTTLDAAAKAVRSVNIGGYRFDPMPEQDADLDWAVRVVKGYSVAGRELRVAPQPDEGTDYTVWYVAYENTLVNGTDVSLCPDQFADLAVLLACSMAHDRPEGHPGAQARFEARYQQALDRAVRTSKPKRGGQLPRTRRDVI